MESPPLDAIGSTTENPNCRGKRIFVANSPALGAYCTWLQKDPLTSGREVIGFTRVEMEGFCVRLDRETFRSPALEATLEEFYP